MRDFASSRGASEVKWFESNGDQKKSRGSTCTHGGAEKPPLQRKKIQVYNTVERRGLGIVVINLGEFHLIWYTCARELGTTKVN